MSRYSERKLETKTGRASLPVRPKVYLGPQVAPGVRLAFRRGERVDSWSTRVLLGTATDKYKLSWFADAERPGINANGTDVLDFLQARDRAKKLVGADKTKDAPATIAEALDAYETHLKATGGKPYNVAYPRKYLPPHWMSRPLPLLTSKELGNWRDGLLKSTDLGQSSITRLCKSVCAAFNLAAEHDDRITANQKAWKVGLANLPGSGNRARNVVISPEKVRAFYTAAYAMDAGLGLLMHTLAVTGARPSQVVRALVSDFVDHPTSPRIMMPRSAKGGSRERNVRREERYLVPITLELARQLRAAVKGCAPEKRLLLRTDGQPWSPNPSNVYRDVVRTIVTSLGENPERVTAYALRHSNITQMLKRGASPEIVAKLHDTSAAEIAKHYAAFIVHHHEDFARTLLLDDGPSVQPPTAGKVISISGKAG